MEESVLNNICRACLTEHGEFQFIFARDESTGLDIHLAEMIMAYASVQVLGPFNYKLKIETSILLQKLFEEF